MVLRWQRKGEDTPYRMEECRISGGEENGETIQKGGEGKIEMGKTETVGLSLQK